MPPADDTPAFAREGLTPTGRVPAEHRVLGLDRRSLLPGLLVLGLFVLWTVLVPGLNSLLSYDSTTKAGDVFLLAPGITMDAQQGWGIENGILTGDTGVVGLGEDVLLTKGAVTLQVGRGPFTGDLRTLLDQIEKVGAVNGSGDALTVAGDRVAFRTNQGTPGIAQGFTSTVGEGVVAAIAVDGTGIKIIATGPGATLRDQADDIERMIDSIRYVPPADR